MRYSLIFFILFTVSSVINVCAAEDVARIVVVSNDMVLTSDDVENVVLRYSKKNHVMVLSFDFSLDSKQKLEAILKPNVGKKISMTIGGHVAMEPVYINNNEITEKMTIYLEDYDAAISLLKKLSK